MIGDENLLFYVNLTGELFYILIHRMNSQGIRYDLQKRVFDDLSLVICNPLILQDLLTGTIKLINYSLTELKLMLSHVVHSSIMNINDYSMEKLFELTLIATKYQYTVCQNPSHILLIALNHTDTMRKHLSDPLSIQSVENLHYTIIESYSSQVLDNDASTNEGQSEVNIGQESQENPMKLYQSSILNYLKDVRLKMTNLIKLGLQKPSGEFIIDPIMIKLNKDVVITQDMLELYADRKIKLGLSIYEMEIEPKQLKQRKSSLGGLVNPGHGHSSSTKHHSSESRHHQQIESNQKDEDLNTKLILEQDANQILKAIQGLDLCGTLLGCHLNDESSSMSRRIDGIEGLKSENSTKTTFNNDSNERKSSRGGLSDEFNIVRIDARYNNNSSTNDNNQILSQIVKEFDLTTEEDKGGETNVKQEFGDDDDNNVRGNGLGRKNSSTKTFGSSTTTAQLLELAMDNHKSND